MWIPAHAALQRGDDVGDLLTFVERRVAQYDAVKRYVSLPHVSPCTPNTLGHHTQDLTGACTHSVDRNSTALRGVKSPFTPSRSDACVMQSNAPWSEPGPQSRTPHVLQPHMACWLRHITHPPSTSVVPERHVYVSLPPLSAAVGTAPPRLSFSSATLSAGGEPDREERDPRPAIGTGDGVSRAAVAACCAAALRIEVRTARCRRLSVSHHRTTAALSAFWLSCSFHSSLSPAFVTLLIFINFTAGPDVRGATRR